MARANPPIVYERPPPFSHQVTRKSQSPRWLFLRPNRDRESVDRTRIEPEEVPGSNPVSGFRSQWLPGGPLDDDPSGGDADRSIRDSLLDPKPIEPQTHTARAGQAWKLVKAQRGHGKRLR